MKFVVEVPDDQHITAEHLDDVLEVGRNRCGFWFTYRVRTLDDEMEELPSPDPRTRTIAVLTSRYTVEDL